MTPFLLSSVLTQAARYCNHPDSAEIGNHFASRALQFLPQDIDRGSQIPTIQGLLILSSREVACGRVAQGWLYSGMAFRMMRDLGLHVAPRKLGYLARQFSNEDLSVRQQVFWSCYTWDKTMSLCLGRAPIIHDVIEIPTPDTIVGGRAGDEEVWVPLATQVHTTKTFSTQKALSSVRFTAYCELAVVFCPINIHDPFKFTLTSNSRSLMTSSMCSTRSHVTEETLTFWNTSQLRSRDFDSGLLSSRITFSYIKTAPQSCAPHCTFCYSSMEN